MVLEIGPMVFTITPGQYLQKKMRKTEVKQCKKLQGLSFKMEDLLNNSSKIILPVVDSGSVVVIYVVVF